MRIEEDSHLIAKLPISHEASDFSDPYFIMVGYLAK